jgi:Ca2+-binding RTX toxin-like protein
VTNHGRNRRSTPPNLLVALWAAVLSVAVLGGSALSAPVPPATSGSPRDDRITGTAKGDILGGGRGDDLIIGGAGRDSLVGGPGYDRLFGGPGGDLISDASDGSNLLDGGPGDDTIDSGRRGMDRVRCGPGRDSVTAGLSDVVADDCEVVVREPAPTPDGPRERRVRSFLGEPLGSTFLRTATPASDPLRLLWVNEGFLYSSAPFRRTDACFIAVEPGGGIRSECGFGGRPHLRPRRIEGDRYRWFAFVPGWATRLDVGGRTVTVRGGVAVFAGGPDLGRVVARGGGRQVDVPSRRPG